MAPKKSAFGYFVNILFLVSVLYALVCGISDLGIGQEYPYVIRGEFFVLLLGTWVLLNGAAAVMARLELEDAVGKRKVVFHVLEVLFVLAVLAGAVRVRVAVIQNFPMEPASDFRTYYEIAVLLEKGTLQHDGAGYCDYVAMFPHVYGYPHFLSILFRIFGTKVSVGQYANVVLAVGTVLLTYRTARLAGGRLAGLTALLLSAFWPSQVLFCNQLASEFLFSFLMMLGVYLFALSIKICTAKMKHPGFGVLLHIAIGIVLGMCAGVRPMALIVVITIFLCVFPRRLFLSAEQSQNPSISLMIISKGWLRCLIVLLCYVLITSANNMTVSQTVGREIASGSTSFGYNLLVGLNTTSKGGWNQDDANYLYDAYDSTGSASQAHLACRDLAMVRLTQDFRSLFNLFLQKFHALWGNDDYGGTWSLLFLNEQGNLTEGRETFLYDSRGWGNLFYLACFAFAGIAGLFLWRKGNDVEYIFVLIYVGTVGMHLLVESQNRYHYHALYMMAILAGCGVNGIYRMNRSKVLKLRETKEQEREALQIRQERIDKMHRDEEELTELRRASMQSKFDMKGALERNLIRVSVSEAYKKENEEGDKPSET